MSRGIKIEINLKNRFILAENLLLKDAQGEEVEIKVHPLILASKSEFFEKIVYSEDSERERETKRKEIMVPDVWGAVDAISHFYGETTNSGKKQAWERSLKFAEAMGVFSLRKILLEEILQEIPKEGSEFLKYLTKVESFVLNENVISINLKVITFPDYLDLLISKVVNFYHYLGEDFKLVGAHLCQTGHQALIKNLVRTLPVGKGKIFSQLLTSLGEGKIEDETTLEELDFKFDKIFRLEKDSRSDILNDYMKINPLYQIKTVGEFSRITGIWKERVLSCSCLGESNYIIHGVTLDNISSFTITKEGDFLISAQNGISRCRKNGEESKILSDAVTWSFEKGGEITYLALTGHIRKITEKENLYIEGGLSKGLTGYDELGRVYTFSGDCLSIVEANGKRKEYLKNFGSTYSKMIVNKSGNLLILTSLSGCVMVDIYTKKITNLEVEYNYQFSDSGRYFVKNKKCSVVLYEDERTPIEFIGTFVAIGENFLIISHNYTFHVVDMKKRKAIFSFPVEFLPVGTGSLSPDEKMISFAILSFTYVYEILTGKLLVKIPILLEKIIFY